MQLILLTLDVKPVSVSLIELSIRKIVMTTGKNRMPQSPFNISISGLLVSLIGLVL